MNLNFSNFYFTAQITTSQRQLPIYRLYVPVQAFNMREFKCHGINDLDQYID